MYEGIRIRPSNYTVIYSTCKSESCWRRGENADFGTTWGDVSSHLQFFIVFGSVLGDLIFAKPVLARTGSADKKKSEEKEGDKEETRGDERR